MTTTEQLASIRSAIPADLRDDIRADLRDSQLTAGQLPVMKPTRGGKRAGAGRKLGSGHGRTVISSSITLPPDLWAKLDILRRDQSRSAFLAAKLRKMRAKKQATPSPPAKGAVATGAGGEK